MGEKTKTWAVRLPLLLAMLLTWPLGVWDSEFYTSVWTFESDTPAPGRP